MRRMALSAGAAGLVALGLLLGAPQRGAAPPPFPPVETVTVQGGTINYRPFGSFALAGKASTPREVPVPVSGFEMMKYQVSQDQYAACVAAEACPPVPATGAALPQTQVNWKEASAFAAWYAEITGAPWRLPTAQEWQLAAAERYGDAVADPGDLDPGERMLARYKAGQLLRGTASPVLRPAGSFGLNSKGIADISGNVWEWTDGCLENGTLAPDGTVASSAPYCWVRIAGGLHRAAIVDFIRDARAGGCAVGIPPDHLGFRLVRDLPPGQRGA